MGKKKYTPPTMTIIKISEKLPLLASSGNGDECENPYWCDEQPDPEDWWKRT